MYVFTVMLLLTVG